MKGDEFDELKQELNDEMKKLNYSKDYMIEEGEHIILDDHFYSLNFSSS